MNELIKLTQSAINGELQQTVDARELHAFLEVGKVFAAWIKNRLDTLGSIEGQDYLVLKGESLLSQTGKQTNDGRGGHNRLEYFVTLDTAKHIAMMEKNERGFQVRQYFITCEKLAKQASTASLSDQLKVAQIGLLNRVLDEFGDKISPQARETLLLVGSEKFLGINTGYRPPVTQQTYSASEIGERLGISGNKVGRLTKAHNLKTEEYGIWVLDQSAHSSKQVTNFRYYENIIPVLKALIQTAL